MADNYPSMALVRGGQRPRSLREPLERVLQQAQPAPLTTYRVVRPKVEGTAAMLDDFAASYKRSPELKKSEREGFEKPSKRLRLALEPAKEPLAKVLTPEEREKQVANAGLKLGARIFNARFEMARKKDEEQRQRRAFVESFREGYHNGGRRRLVSKSPGIEQYAIEEPE